MFRFASLPYTYLYNTLYIHVASSEGHTLPTREATKETTREPSLRPSAWKANVIGTSTRPALRRHPRIHRLYAAVSPSRLPYVSLCLSLPH